MVLPLASNQPAAMTPIVSNRNTVAGGLMRGILASICYRVSGSGIGA